MCNQIHIDIQFLFYDMTNTPVYTLSLHDALPISHLHLIVGKRHHALHEARAVDGRKEHDDDAALGIVPSDDLDSGDRKSTRLNSSHLVISYAVFCLKKKKKRKKSRSENEFIK